MIGRFIAIKRVMTNGDPWWLGNARDRLHYECVYLSVPVSCPRFHFVKENHLRIHIEKFVMASSLGSRELVVWHNLNGHTSRLGLGFDAPCFCPMFPLSSPWSADSSPCTNSLSTRTTKDLLLDTLHAYHLLLGFVVQGIMFSFKHDFRFRFLGSVNELSIADTVQGVQICSFRMG